MTTEKAIRWFEETVAGCHVTGDRELIEVCTLAISALRAQQQAEKNDPLTLEELREMDGEPVYLDCGAIGEWVLVIASELAVFLRHKNGIKAPAKIAFECGAKLYRHKPEED